MNGELRKAKDRADNAWQQAVMASYQNVRTVIGTDYRIALWSNSINDMYEKQWCSEPLRAHKGWDWPSVHRRHRGPKDQVAALITGDRLAALTCISASRERVTVRLLEGDSSGSDVLKSKRALIMLDLAATYGQVLGCNEIYLVALNDALLMLYQDSYGFTHAPTKEAPLAMRRGLI